MAVGSASDKTGKLEVRPEEHAALVDGRPLSLTVRELQLLITLWSNPQRILTLRDFHSSVSGTPPRRRPLSQHLRQPPPRRLSARCRTRS